MQLCICTIYAVMPIISIHRIHGEIRTWEYATYRDTQGARETIAAVKHDAY